MMWGLASCPAQTHVVGAAPGRSATVTATASPPAVGPRRQQRQQQRRLPTTRTAASSLDAVAMAAAVSSGGSSAVQQRADGGAVQPPPADVQQANEEYAAHCQSTYGRPGLIDFSTGAGGLPKAVLQHPGGARCELYLHGGAVTSWRHADGREMLHLREGNSFNGRDPISGGIQIAWPQYGVGALPTHGFLQNVHWSVVETGWREPGEEEGQPGSSAAAAPGGGASAAAAAAAEQGGLDWRPTLSLYTDTDEEWAQQWPHKFEALYSVTLMQPEPPKPSDTEVLRAADERYQPWVHRQRAADAAAAAGRRKTEEAAAEGRGRWGAPPMTTPVAADGSERTPATPSVLRCMLQVHNSGEEPFTFTTGLRTHYATRDIPTHPKFVKTLGLRGKHVLDYAPNPLKPRLAVEGGDYLFFADMAPKDRVYVDCEAQGDILFCPGSPSHFNIGNKQGFSDIAVAHPTTVAPKEARGFVVLASARAVRKVTLQPGAVWVGEMVLTAHDRYWELPAWELEETDGVPIPEQSPEMLPGFKRRSATGSMLDSEDEI